MPNWSVAFFTAVAFGRIAIPILPDSSENEVNNIINHYESDVLFVSQRLYPKISDMLKGKMKLIVDMDTLEVIKSDDSRHVVSYVLREKSVLSPETSGSGCPAESHEDSQADLLRNRRAKLDGEVEAFLLKSGFPYAVGYGLTETSPLAGYSLKGWRSVGSFGYPVHNVNIKLIDVNPETGEGEVAIKGPNVMLGYYKDLKRTKSVFNNQEGVTESIVIERNGRLVALVQPCDGFIDWDAEGEDRIYEKIDAWKAKLLKKVNKNVNKTSQVSSIEVMKEPFEKTATMKIRRFKYKDSAPTVEAERAAEAGKDSKNTDSCLK